LKENHKPLAKALVGEILFNTESPVTLTFTMPLPLFTD